MQGSRESHFSPIFPGLGAEAHYSRNPEKFTCFSGITSATVKAHNATGTNMHKPLVYNLVVLL